MPQRYLCTVLDEMRQCHRTRNYSYLPGLIEEAQTLANRMEAAIGTQHEVRSMERRRQRLKVQIKELEKAAGEED